MFTRFRRDNSSPFPDDMPARLDRLGRCKLDMANCGVDWSEVLQNCIAPFHAQAIADPEAFLTDLLRLIAVDTRGFPTYGAASLMYELASDHIRSVPGTALLDLAVAFKVQRGLPGMSMNGYEWERWLATRPPQH